MNNTRWGAVAVMLAACATTKQEVSSAVDPERVAATVQVAAQLQRIESGAFRGESEALKSGFDAQARERPGDPLPRVYAAWVDMPADEAWNQLKAINTLFPELPWPHLGMARVYIKWKMWEPCQAELAPLLRADPGFFPALTTLGELARAREKYDEAAGHYRAALALHEDPRARAGLGLTLLAQGDKAGALTELKRSFATWGDIPEALVALQGLAQESKDEVLLPAVERLVELKPKDRAARARLAELRLARGDKKAATEEYERLLRLGNPELTAVARLASLYRELGNAAQEERTVQLQSGLAPKDPAPPFRLAELALAKGDKEAAEGQCLEALEREPAFKPARLALAQLKREQGLLHEAYDALKLAGETDEADRLRESFKLPRKPFAGSVEAVYGQVARSANELYLERKRARPSLAGVVKVRVRVDAQGQVTATDLLSSTVEDPLLSAHIFLALREAQYARKKRDPVFEFELGKASK